MPRTISVAALQTSYGTDLQANIDKTIDLIRQAADKGAQVILPSELFQGPYFCVTQEEDWFATAHPWREHPCVTALAPVAKDLGVAIPVSIFERDGPHYYNSLVMLDADGEALGANRTGHEQVTEAGQTFYGSSFIADHRGDLVETLGRHDEGVLVHEFDLDFLDRHRAAWGFFRDRRTDLYGALTGKP